MTRFHRISNFRFAVMAAASAGALASGGARAQTADTAAAAEDQSGLEEIVVTATRRAENLQDVPVSITAVTESALATAGTYNVLDLERIAPGLQVYQTGASVLPFLRGIGSNQSSPGFESPVAIYVDGIYQATKSANTFDLPNIERIEVLKGPQGTLFGRNATGGAISIVTKDPGQDAELRAEAGYGRFDEVRAKLYAEAPVTDTLAAGLGLSGRWDDGYIRNTFLNRSANPADNLIAMGKLVWTPNGDFTARLSGSYYEHNDPTFLSPHVVEGTIPSATSLTGAGGAPVPEYDEYEMRARHETFVNTSGYRATLNLDYDLGAVSLVSWTGYIDADASTRSNSPASEILLGYSGSNQPGEQFSQEFQLQSNDGPFDWIAGVYYAWIQEGFADLLSASNLPSPIRPIDLATPGASATGFHVDLTTNAYAAFAEANVNLTEALRLTGGLRYSSEKREADGFRYSYSALPAAGNTNLDLYNTVLGNEPLVFGQTIAAASITNADKTFSKLTWRAALDYKVNDDVMAYASFNRGFKSGTYNPTSLSTTAVPVEPEVLDAYEVGIKTEFLDRRLRLNAAAFYYDYSNIQVGLITAAGVTAVQNAAAARVQGIDVDLTAAATDNLTIRAAFNILDSKFKNYTSAQIFLPKTTATPCTAPPPAITPAQAEALTALPKFPGSCSYSLNANGQDLIFAPKFTGNVAADYNIPVGDARVLLTGSLYYNGGYDVTPGGYFAHIDSYVSTSASLTYYAPNDAYFVRLWGDNLTDDDHPIYISPQALAFQEVAARPISYGITLGFKFGGE